MNTATPRNAWSASLAALAILVWLITFGDVWVQEMHGTAAFYAALAREMVVAGDFLAPFEGPQAYLLKPPLAFWLSAFSAHLFGLNDFAMTLPSRLAGLGCAALTFLLGRRLYGFTGGWFAALVFVTNGIYIQFTTNFRMDSLMTLGALLTVWGYLHLHLTRGACYFFLGLAIATLTKGPMIFAIALVFIPHALVVGRWREIDLRAAYWMGWLVFPLLWFGYLWLQHGAEVSAQLNADFWRENSAFGLSAMDSAVLEYLVKPLNRLWPWQPFMLLGLGYALAATLRGRAPRELRADIALILALFVLNYGIAAIKPDPDVRYLYPSLPLLAVLTGGFFARFTALWFSRWASRSVLGLIVLATAFIAVTSYRAIPDQQGLSAIKILGASRTLTSANTVVLNDDIPPPDAPRRNDPLRDSAYFYLGFAPPNLRWPADAAALPPTVQFFVARRKRSYAARLLGLGLQPRARSAKLLLFEKRGEPAS